MARPRCSRCSARPTCLSVPAVPAASTKAETDLLLRFLPVPPDPLAGVRRRCRGAGRRRARPPLPTHWLQGYVRTVAGDWLVYPWAYPGQTRSLLSRATDGRMTVEWEGEPVPDGRADELVTFLWHGGHRVGLRRPPVLVRGERHGRRDVHVGRNRDDRELVGAGRGGSRRSRSGRHGSGSSANCSGSCGSRPRAAVRRRRPRVLGDGRGRRQPGLLPRPAGAGARSGRASAPRKRCSPTANVPCVSPSASIGPARPARGAAETASLWSGTVGPGHTTVLAARGAERRAHRAHRASRSAAR